MEPKGRLVGVVGAIALAAVIVGGVIGWAIGHSGRKAATVAETTVSGGTVDPKVAAGAHDFVQFACAQCHGLGGRGGVSADVPALTGLGTALTVDQLTSIIDHGLGESANPDKPYMPVWKGVVSPAQVSDLVEYIRAGLPNVPLAEPVPIPEGQGAAVAGSRLYVRYGCINCHGPNGLGGIPNPEAEDKTIPALAGADFRAEFNTDAKVAEMIRSGSVIGKPPIVSMPHWGGILSDEQLADLVAYLKTFS